MKRLTEESEVLELLKQVRSGQITPEEAVLGLKTAPFEDLGYAKVDYHRGLRQGVPEVIYGQGKNAEQILGILEKMGDQDIRSVLVTRITQETADFLSERVDFKYYAIPQLGVAWHTHSRDQAGLVAVASGGTSDMKICEEAAVTAEVFGSKVLRLYDVGVAGLHRLLSHVEQLMQARAVVAVAGMEGALASVVGGLVSCPVIAVPTSVGYGANFGGLSALLAMLNSCASGVSVVNIDNGFGAGYIANRINRMEGIR
jgi:NCAIR mutase (PurE)-related protein